MFTAPSQQSFFCIYVFLAKSKEESKRIVDDQLFTRICSMNTCLEDYHWLIVSTEPMLSNWLVIQHRGLFPDSDTIRLSNYSLSFISYNFLGLFLDNSRQFVDIQRTSQLNLVVFERLKISLANFVVTKIQAGTSFRKQSMNECLRATITTWSKNESIEVTFVGRAPLRLLPTCG